MSSDSAILQMLRTQLAAHSPFAEMTLADLDALIERATAAYFAPGETIAEPDDGPAETCYLIRQGRVRSAPVEAIPGTTGSHELTAGEMFPIGAVMGRRAARQQYRAVGDVFCLCLDRGTFDAMRARSPVFEDFCIRRMAHLLDRSRAEIQAAYVSEMASQNAMDQPLRTLLRRKPVTCATDTPLREALAAMHSAKVGSVVAVDAAQRPLGILTRGDLVGRIILPQRDLNCAVSVAMSQPVHTLQIDAPLGDAALMMARHGIQHLPLVEGETLAGVVSERDLFGLQRQSLREVSRGIRKATSLEQLVHAAADIRALTHGLVAQGVGAARLTRFISALNDQLTQALLALIAPTHALDDLRWCWIAMGSEGREEQTISTDQDNGLIFVADAADAQKRLLAFALEVNHALRDCGFPLCSGGIMASNPKWCLPLVQWQQVFTQWIERGDPESLLNASIFFDFRPLAGELRLAFQLRDLVTRRAQSHTRFLHLLAANALRQRPPLNWLGRVAEDRAGQVDLKKQGAQLFTDAARVLALAAGVDATDTETRLRLTASKRQLHPNSLRNWIDAFHFLQRLRLTAQHQRTDGDHLQANRVDPDRLSAIDQRILREAFRQIRTLQQRLSMDFPP